MVKVLLFGTGNVFNRYKDRIDWESVVGIIDSNIEKYNQELCGFRIQLPCIIDNYDYDFIVIFSNDYFKEIKEMLLGVCGVHENKIVSYPFFLDNYNLWSEESKSLALYFMLNSEGAVLDTDEIGYTRYRESLSENRIIHNVVNCRFEYQWDYYAHATANGYSSIMLWGDFEKKITFERIELINPMQIFWYIPYSYLKEAEYNTQRQVFGKKYQVVEFRFLNELVVLCKKRKNVVTQETIIYQVCHKEYNCFENNIYKTIRVGNSVFEANYSDNSGDNIAYLNDRINECTAIFWIWKNKRTEYVGINHYRRHFFLNEVKERGNLLNIEYIKKILVNDNTLIVPELTRLDVSIADNICSAVGRDLYTNALKQTRRCLGKYQPDYLDSFETVLNGNVMYRCNMFVATWKLFDAYCSWLFSFLIELAEAVDVSNCSVREKRVVGYFAETMLTVWLNNQHIITYEMTISDI